MLNIAQNMRPPPEFWHKIIEPPDFLGKISDHPRILHPSGGVNEASIIFDIWPIHSGNGRGNREEGRLFQNNTFFIVVLLYGDFFLGILKKSGGRWFQFVNFKV